MPTPKEYEAQYKSLKVEFEDGPVTVSIQAYLEGKGTMPWDAQADKVIDASREAFQEEKKKDPKFALTLSVSGKSVSIDKENVLVKMLHYAFEGKGSPEDCQVAAQMVVRHSKETKASLPAYCTAHMGLDCTGFVGNYLWYILGGKSWPDQMPGGNDGPNALIGKIVLKGTTPVTDLSLIRQSDLVILGLLDASNNLVDKDGDGGRHAHIVISQPGMTPILPFPFFGLTSDEDTFATECVESTGEIGLTDSYYSLTPVMDKKGTKQLAVPSHPGFKVFSVIRGCKPSAPDSPARFTIGSISAA